MAASEDRRVWQAVYSGARYHTRRLEALATLGGACTECGTTEHLEVVRIGEGRKFQDFWNLSHANFLTHLPGCIILCSAHRRARNNHPRAVPHGGGKSGRRNCRCIPCLNRKSEYMRDYYRTRKGQG